MAKTLDDVIARCKTLTKELDDPKEYTAIDAQTFVMQHVDRIFRECIKYAAAGLALFGGSVYATAHYIFSPVSGASGMPYSIAAIVLNVGAIIALAKAIKCVNAYSWLDEICDKVVRNEETKYLSPPTY